MNKMLTRSAVLAFMNIETDSEKLPRYSLIGAGFTKLAQTKKPHEYTRKFVNQQAETTDIIKYDAEISYEADVLSNDPVIEFITGIADEEQRGKSTIVDILTVYTEEIVARPRVCRAIKRFYKIIPGTQGDDVSIYRTTGKMVSDSDPEDGFYDLYNATYTPKTPYVGVSVVRFNLARFNTGNIYERGY